MSGGNSHFFELAHLVADPEEAGHTVLEIEEAVHIHRLQSKSHISTISCQRRIFKRTDGRLTWLGTGSLTGNRGRSAILSLLLLLRRLSVLTCLRARGGQLGGAA